MLQSVHREDIALTKDELRIQSKREANEQRRKRFLDARTRLIGLDVEGLNQQVAEKQRIKDEEKTEAKLERQRILEIQRILETVAMDEKQHKDAVNKDVINNWSNAIETKKKMLADNVEVIPEPGLASAQVFYGEDEYYDDRVKNQKDQMKRWVQEDLDIKAHRKALEQKENDKYNEMIKAVNEIRLAAENDEKEMKKFMRLNVKDQNLQLANTQRQQRYYENNAMKVLSKEEILKATTLQVPDDGNLAIDDYGHIIRRDMFRGYTDEQRRRIIQENDQIIQFKRELSEEEKKYEQCWVEHDSMLVKTMEQAHYNDTTLRHTLKLEQVETLKQQMQEQVKARELSEKARFGSVGPEFFGNFGSSCR